MRSMTKYHKDLKVTYNNLSGKYNVVDYDDDKYGCPKGQGKTPEEAIQNCLHLFKSCREVEIAMFRQTVSDFVVIDDEIYQISTMSKYEGEDMKGVELEMNKILDEEYEKLEEL